MGQKDLTTTVAPEVFLWLSSLSPVDRLTMLIAMSYAFKHLNGSPSWKKRIKVARDEVLPSKAEDGAICETAQRIARGIREELRGA
jgi:hypothetical protein